MRNAVKVLDGELLSGRSLLYRDANAARRASARYTTNPGVTAFSVSGVGEWYAADGDWWIDTHGQQGQHLYGRRGKLLTVVEVERNA